MLKTLKECFSRILPTKDGRANTSPHDFVAALVFTFVGDTKHSSLEGFRREMMSHLGVEFLGAIIARSASFAFGETGIGANQATDGSHFRRWRFVETAGSKRH